MSTLSVQTVPQTTSPSRSRHLRALPRPEIRRKPRLVHGIVALAGLGLIMAVQLGLSLMLSDGAYQLSALQSQSSQLSRDAQGLNEQLDVLSSPQDLGLAAQELGMVQGQASQFIQLSSGAILGGPDALHVDGSVSGRTGLNVPNELVTRSDEAAQAAAAEAIAAASASSEDDDVEPYPGMVSPTSGASGE